MKVPIYRLCRDQEKIDKLQKDSLKYNLPETIYLKGMDLYEFINHIIKNCKTDYACICHDDVIIPQNIDENITNCIESSDAAFGTENWGVIGNAGVEIISKKTSTFISDPHTNILPPRTKYPLLVESIDGNTMLLNLKNLRNKKVELPNSLSGYHLYDVILCAESYKKGLVCGVSSWLYVIHKSPGNYNSFLKSIEEEQYQSYFADSFSNHQITTINGLISIKRDYSHLYKKDISLISLERTITETVEQIFEQKELSLNLIIRLHTKSKKIFRLLDSIKILQEKAKGFKISVHLGINNISPEEIRTFIKQIKTDYSELKIVDHYIENVEHRAPRVETLAKVTSTIKTEDSYCWIVDYDDFVMPEIGEQLRDLLINNEIVVGDAYVFEEKWKRNETYPIKSALMHKIGSKDSINILTGKNYVPICSVIYKTEILQEVFEENELLGDYFEDYAILLLASQKARIHKTPLPFAGISYHGENTVLETDRSHWDYSYVTFLAEIINKGLIPNNFAEYLAINHNSEALEFQGFKKGLIWKSLMKYRRLKSMVLSILRR